MINVMMDPSLPIISSGKNAQDVVEVIVATGDTTVTMVAGPEGEYFFQILYKHAIYGRARHPGAEAAEAAASMCETFGWRGASTILYWFVR